MHVYLSDRLFVALAKRLGVPRRRLATLRLRQQGQVRDGVAVSLFSLARLERWIDEKSAAHLLSCARRVIRKHPKYRRDLIEVRQGGRRRRRSSSCDDLPALDAHADALAQSVESLFQTPPVQVTPVQVTPVQVTPVHVTPIFAEPEPVIGYQADPLLAQPIEGAPILDIASLLMGDPIRVDDSPVGHDHDALAEPLSRDLGADSSLFAVADWSAEQDFPDPFAVDRPFDSSEDPFAASANDIFGPTDTFGPTDAFGPTTDPFALAANGSLDTVGDPFAAAAQQVDAFGPMIDPFAASSEEIHGDPFSSTEDPFANSQPDPYASVGGDPFASKGAGSDWRRESQEFDPFGL